MWMVSAMVSFREMAIQGPLDRHGGHIRTAYASWIFQLRFQGRFQTELYNILFIIRGIVEAYPSTQPLCLTL